MKRLRLHVLASGSKANSSVIEDTQTKSLIVVDCGLSWKAFHKNFERCGLDEHNIKGILLTHEHTDHVKGLGVLLRQLQSRGVTPHVLMDIRTWNTSETVREAIRSVNVPASSFRQWCMFELYSVSVFPMATSHDSDSSCGFTFVVYNGCDIDKLGFLTDTGCVSTEIEKELCGCRILALESNHDEQMLETSDYPEWVKRRIASDKGHLSNAQAARLLERIKWDGLEQVVAMHVSQNANTYATAAKNLAGALGGTRAYASTSYQNMCVTIE